MSRISEKFESLKSSGEGALVCFVTVGDPDPESTLRIVLELERAGADIVELGLPFSDPIADGSTIQASYLRSLEKGTNVPKVLDVVCAIRAESQVPLVLMTYYNPVMHYGLVRFADEAKEAGVDGVILTDVTPEEAGVWKAEANRVGLDTIFLLAPTSTEPRIQRVAELGSGFIYCVSRTGVTGARAEMAGGVHELVASIRAKTEKPIVVGFGISKPEHVREVCGYADGAVVGSLLVDLIARESGSDSLYGDLANIVSDLKSGTRK